MIREFSTIKWSVLLLGSVIAFNVYGDTIYCEGNKQMMCLGFEQKIVDNNAVCFEPFACGQEGFVCKSELDILADEHESLLSQHNELVDTHNELLGEYENALSQYGDVERCVIAATSLDEAKSCI